MIFFIKKLSTSFETVKQNIQNKFDSERIQMVEISKLKFDKDFKELFAQEPEKVERIAQVMKEHGYDKSQPIIVTKKDGYYQICMEVCGIQKENIQIDILL